MTSPISHLSPLSLLFILAGTAIAGLEPGEQIHLTLRGVSTKEQEEVSGNYRIGESGKVRLPLLKDLVQAGGLSPEEFGRAVEKAYIDAGIYTRPAVEIETVQGSSQQSEARISVGGQVRRAGEAAFHQGMTVIQALDAVGGRNDFGGRNLMLLRDGKEYCLDFNKLHHKNIELRPGDSIQVQQKGVVDRWKGDEDRLKDLLPKND
ncbi:hypothetical protein JIN85_17655 [Luteolibacter pohnpeiensis]|uniref:Soluble ligand binding domain-containing protein n=1 Tax=Luteolibacter pohnpeiensis TaxID=454153 RepID=A0A934SA87_9BACT|nr:hypothetical protein [Luteolibacter pohnpeiensis]MBK1884250.1 hypothetical protein [Luteolibacter pohnpeiensis]